MSAFARPVISIDSPDAEWLRLKSGDKVAIARAVRADQRMSGGEHHAYAAVFDGTWPRRRAKKTQPEWARLAGETHRTFKRHLTGLRERGYVAGRRFAHVLELIVNPTRAELEDDPVWRRAQQRKKDGTARKPKPRFRGMDGRFVAESDRPIMADHIDHRWPITYPQTDDSKEQFSASSSIYEQPIVVNAPKSPANPCRVDDESGASRPEQPVPVAAVKPLSVEKPKRLSPRDEFLEWFEAKYPREFLSRRDLDEIENHLSHYGIGWGTFTEGCKRICTSDSPKSAVALVKHIAKCWPQRTQPPKVVPMPVPIGWPAEPIERKPCPTCKSRTGLLPDDSPCPDCDLGRELAKQAAWKARRAERQGTTEPLPGEPAKPLKPANDCIRDWVGRTSKVIDDLQRGGAS